MSSDEWYAAIKKAIGVHDLTLEPMEVVEVIMHGLLGPDLMVPQENLPGTANSCRLNINGQLLSRKKENNFPILVLDEFNPIDFVDSNWPDDVNFFLKQLSDRIGKAFDFLNCLAGAAHQCGFVVFLGTRSKAVARALHKINGGSKAALARSTTCKPNVASDGSYPFEDWRGFQWSVSQKESLVKACLEQKYLEALERQGLTLEDSQTHFINSNRAICSQNDTIRACMDQMREEIVEAESLAAIVLQIKTHEDAVDSGRCSGVGEQIKAVQRCCIL